MIAAIAINVVRLASLAHFPQHFSVIHVGWGGQVFGWLGLGAIVATVITGFWGKIIARR